jgi:hypothetical protein
MKHLLQSLLELGLIVTALFISAVVIAAVLTY